MAPPGRMMDTGRRSKNAKATLKRLMKYLGKYKLRLVFIVICIVLSAAAQAGSALFLQPLIDDYIAPLVHMETPVFTGLLKAVTMMITQMICFTIMVISTGSRVRG